MLKINNVELELDLMDADTAEKYEKAIKNLDEKEKNKQEGLGMAETIRQECKLVFDFFNEVFGEGTDKKIFGNKTNYAECEKAFKQVCDYTVAQTTDLRKRTAKYSSNRVKR